MGMFNLTDQDLALLDILRPVGIRQHPAKLQGGFDSRLRLSIFSDERIPLSAERGTALLVYRMARNDKPQTLASRKLEGRLEVERRSKICA